jgi:hypothetical protein
MQPFAPGDPSYGAVEHSIGHAVEAAALPAAGRYRLGLYLPDARAAGRGLGRVVLFGTAARPL